MTDNGDNIESLPLPSFPQKQISPMLILHFKRLVSTKRSHILRLLLKVAGLLKYV